jgi:uncharacterized protein with FMN-binding domain
MFTREGIALDRKTLHLSILGMLMTVMAAFPIGSAWATPTSAAGVAAVHTAASKPSTKSKKYKGPSIDMRWGTVQVTIVVKSKKIVDVLATAPNERTRSQIINEQALPMLRDEVLTAQSANIDEVSRASDTSAAYIESLQAAIKHARQKKDLK